MKKYGRDIEEKRLIKKIIKHGQENVLYFWEELNDDEKSNLINDLHAINLTEIRKYFKNFLEHESRQFVLQPAEYLSMKARGKLSDIKSIGERSLRSNEIAILTIAGGQGSRLGHDRPKGFFPVSPVKNKSLFQIFAEKIKFYSGYYKNNFNWYIMTSELNYYDTMSFFKKNEYFGLNEKNIVFFKQGMFPSLTMEGKLILREKDRLFLNPDGHGGVLKALIKNGLLHKMKDKGIKHLSFFQVDNPLVNMADPYFIGYHIQHKSMVSTKVIAKLYPEEKLGSICKINGTNSIIEYSDFPKEKMPEKYTDGRLKYLMGSIAIHLFDIQFLLDFIKKIPVHFAERKLNGYYFPENQGPVLREMDGIKFETFIFDSIPHAKRSIFFETEREVEFSPLKNKTGLDSIETCLKGQNKLFAGWLRESGLWKGEYKDQKVEISPLYAPDKEIFLENVHKDSGKVREDVFDNDGNIKDEIYIE